ncbi:MAG: hypothetical protein MK218_04230 [Gammaproteobacteria bacterium]|jgi:ribonuclease D|nr:hypothetical protein [Gammaproteobacteria bacterium]|tara:strand:+ start:531 stop:1649 length:1119 start_codon:yes stop_codon:yes gene_type:complete
MREKKKAFKFIDSQKSLDGLVSKLEHEKTIGIDTEFVRTRTYFPKLCLIQIASTNTMSCIDCLTGLDMSKLWSLIYSPDIEKVLHSGSQDLEIFFMINKALPSNVFDTQIAASLLGYPTQIGIKNLLIEELGISISKSETRSDWSKRPLDKKQIIYAIDDIAYLLRLGASLKKKLKAKKRLDWSNEDCKSMLTLRTGLMDQENAWKKISGIKKLKLNESYVAISLANWREATAAKKNIPRKWLMEDSDLIQLATININSLKTIDLNWLIGKNFNDQDIDEIEALIKNPEKNTTTNLTSRKKGRHYYEKNNKLIQKINKEVAKQSGQLGITQEVLATKKDVIGLVNKDQSRLNSGWRKSVLGQKLQQIIASSK